MKIVVAKTAGFCMGVRRAVDMVLDESNLSREQIYTYGPLIHNPQVLKMLEEKKITLIDQIPETGTGTVLIRAHGVPPEDEKALKDAGFSVKNATCPRVVKVQAIINKYAEKGYSTIIAGDEKHPEVVGLLGYTQKKGHTITILDQLDALPRFDNAVVVAQTTQDTAFYNEIKTWCQANAPHYKIFDTICGSTERRQVEIRELARENDAVVVIGGRQSGNTRRLAQIAAGTGKPALHVEDASQLDYESFAKAESVAVTAGASTPNWIINDAFNKIESSLYRRHPAQQFLFSIRDFLLKTNIMASACAGFLTYACSVVQAIAQSFYHALIAMLYIFSMQVLNNLFTIKSDKYNHPQRALFYTQNRVFLWFSAVLSGIAGLYLSYMTGVLSFFILLVMSLLGLSYNLRIIPFFSKNKKFVRMKDIPGSKTILITIAWGTVTCLLPAVAYQSDLLTVAAVFLFAIGIVFARTAFFDTLAIQGDRITGKETLPILLGEKKSLDIIQYVLIADMFIIFSVFFIDPISNKASLLAFTPFIMLLLIRFFKKESLVSGRYQEFVIESSFIIAGLTALFI